MNVPPRAARAYAMQSALRAGSPNEMNHFPPPTTPPAGWYPDPMGFGQRYFDGLQWATGAPPFAEREKHPVLPIASSLGAIVVLVASLVTAKTLIGWLVQFDWPVVVYVAILVALGYGPSLIWAWYVRQRWAGGQSSSIGWRFRWSDAGWGPVTWMAAIGTQVVLAVVVLALKIPLSSNVEDASDFGADRAYIVATVIAAVIAAPIVEEIVFRGLMMRGFLSRMAPALAIGLQGVLFGIAHVDPVRGRGNVGLALVLSGVGVALGTAAYLARRLGPTIIAHAIFNGVVMIIVLTGALDNVDSPYDRVANSSGSAAISAAAQHAIVDQAYVAEPNRDQHHCRGINVLDCRQSVDVDDLQVLEPRSRFPTNYD